MTFYLFVTVFISIIITNQSLIMNFLSFVNLKR
jgi:hypothetical protein